MEKKKYCCACGYKITNDYMKFRCAICHGAMCGKCRETCSKCHEDVCTRCSHSCETCGDVVCNDCGGETKLYKECSICHDAFCKHELKRWIDNKRVCKSCISRTPVDIAKGSCPKLGHGKLIAGFCKDCNRIYYKDGAYTNGKSKKDVGNQTELTQWFVKHHAS